MIMSMEQLMNENWQGKPKQHKKTYPSAILTTTNPATNHLS
jgi:hypothetical protein